MRNIYKLGCTVILIVLLVVGQSTLFAQKASGSAQEQRYDIEFVNFQLADTTVMGDTELLEGTIKNNGPQRFVGKIKLHFLITDSMISPGDIDNYSALQPDITKQTSSLKLAVDEGQDVEFYLPIDENNFKAAAPHGTLIWPTIVYSGDDQGNDINHANNRVAKSIYVLGEDEHASEGTRQTTGIDPQSNESSFTIYPNPTTSSIKLTINETQSTPSLVRLINMKGQIVKEIHWSESQKTDQISVADLSPGLYKVRVERGQAAPLQRSILISE